MKLMEPGVCQVDVARGELVGATNRYVKTLADLEGLYEDEAAFRIAEATGSDGGCLRGHRLQALDRRRRHDRRRHADAAGQGRARIFPHPRPHPRERQSSGNVLWRERTRRDAARISGRRDPHGRIAPRTLCYVPPFWIHRSVNVGDDELVMTFAYPADSGQDYAIIEEAGGMRSRVVDDGTRLDARGQRQLPRPPGRQDRAGARRRLVTKLGDRR